MRIHVLSDLHNEFDRYCPEAIQADVVVLAGDVDLGLRGLEWAAEVFAPTPIVYVAGNHEYYHSALPHLTDKLHERALQLGVHFLERGSVTIGGVRFLGTTLWTDFALFGDPATAELAAATRMSDYRLIRLSPAFRRLRPSDTAALHAKSVRWLERELQNRNIPTVVVTHHAPSRLGLRRGTETSILSAAYASNLDRFIELSGARLWIHGHTHQSVDTRIGKVPVVSNPRGYVPDEPNPNFDPTFIAEI